ncbi:hypothetical protein [Pyrococcus kukulkanii]|uniref:Uncharacterized protein n=1 Tax=Pyrococcus kukulkanii TaxID=1609559 RepID=A0A127B9D9_9EURY|nr:hypothetical protein [Pyrococcus kukulkanii]AMM53914.1 hypothetical protein TQ32_05025 [Pyrococcus kukulkanii]
MGIREWWDERKRRKRIQQEVKAAREILQNYVIQHKDELIRGIINKYVGSRVYFYYPYPENIGFKWRNEVEILGDGIYRIKATVKIKTWLELEILFPGFDRDRVRIGTDINFIFGIRGDVNVYTGEVSNFGKTKYIRYKTYGQSYVRLYDKDGKIVWEKTWSDWYDEGYSDGYHDGENDGYSRGLASCPC